MTADGQDHRLVVCVLLDRGVFCTPIGVGVADENDRNDDGATMVLSLSLRLALCAVCW